MRNPLKCTKIFNFGWNMQVYTTIIQNAGMNKCIKTVNIHIKNGRLFRAVESNVPRQQTIFDKYEQIVDKISPL